MWSTGRWDGRGRPPLVGKGDRRGRPRGRIVPLVETLESRTLLANLMVTSLKDDGGPGTLREIIKNSKPGDTIDFAPNLDAGTIFLKPANGPLMIQHTLTIQGRLPSPTAITIDGQGQTRIFTISADTTVKLAYMTVQDGMADSGGGGGGIYSQGDLIIQASVVRDNRYVALPQMSASGGGIENFQGSLTIRDSVIANNTAQGGIGGTLPIGGNGNGGGVASLGGPLSIRGISAIIDNKAIGGAGITPPLTSGKTGDGGDADGGGIFAQNALLTIAKITRISGNLALGGQGAPGAVSMKQGVTGGAGGSGGNALGGAIFEGFLRTIQPLRISQTPISGNMAIGGDGGPGGGGYLLGTGSDGGAWGAHRPEPLAAASSMSMIDV
jgi:hypothetical protein